MAKENIFNELTGKYQLSKTLRLELKPVGNTQQMLKDEDVFEKDRIIREKYRETRPHFDRLHREFIEQALKNQKLSDLGKYFQCLAKLQNNKKDKEAQEEFKRISQNLRKEVNDLFKIDPLFGEGVFALLKEKYGEKDDAFLREQDGQYVLDENKKKISIFDSWKGFTGYFTKFQETRKNFYKDDGTATAVATRIIDQNLKRFCENIQIFKSIQKKVDFKEVEDNFSVDLEDIFSLGFYSSCFLQEGIDVYNKILGGEPKTTGEKLRGLNELINRYRQDHKGEKLPFFKMLDKQILSEKEKFIESIEDDEELLKTLKEFYSSAEEKTTVLKELFNDFIKNNENYDLSEIYISREALNTISHRWVSAATLPEFEKSVYEVMKKDKPSGLSFDKDDNSYKFPDFIALSYIKGSFEKLSGEKLWKDGYFRDETRNGDKGFLIGNESLWTQFIKIFEFEFNSLFEAKNTERSVGYYHFKKDFEKIITNDFSVNPEDKVIIREFADNVLAIYQMAKYFAIEKKRKWMDQYDTGDFYNHPDFGYKTKFYDNAYEKIVKARMLLQSYLTKKPFSTDKWKLNFECGYLLNGWSSSFNTYGSLLFRTGNEYYLGVVNGSALRTEKIKRLTGNITEANSCHKMVYDFQKPDNKNVPRIFIRSKGDKFAPAVSELNLPVDSILEIYDKGLFKTENKNSPFFKPSLKKLIDYFKLGFSRHASYKHYQFKWKDSSEYKNISEFYNDTIRSCYQIKWEELNFEEVKKLTNSKDLFLFQIYNKDFSEKSTGNKNLHSIYFDGLFLDNNINAQDGVILKLSGGGEIFFRPKTDVKKLGSRTDTKGKLVIKNKRYSQDKIFLHFPIELNYSNTQESNFNKLVRNFLADNPDINIIGVDRGEKHLIYYAGIDQKGNTLKDKDDKDVLGSLNEINGVNYYKLLEERAKAREKARQDWQNIQGIKDLKMGYISLVVRKLADLIIEYNAILVLEDLNMRFKQIHGGIEKSVYQQLEKALIEKLNFLVNKGEKDPERAGHLLRAYQLTAPFSTFKDMGKQTGVLFYTQASYTSKTCPQCGFRPNIKLHFDNLENAKKMLEKINIVYKDNHFEIGYKVSDFTKTEKTSRGNILYGDRQGKDTFVISSKAAIRYKWFARNIKNNELNRGESLKEHTEKGVTIQYDITECLKILYEKNGIDHSGDITKQSIRSELPAKFYKDLLFYLYLLTNTRSSISGTEIDYINCPDCGFHSEKGFNGCIFNGDANGAYNIARKGMLILKKINQYKDQHHTMDKMGWGDLFIGIEEWDKYTQVVSRS
ncbi:MAG: hypothetical protein G01um101433_161 [Parcubacteria group bacterium Gr01-1014_33]|nr:MAG: hypothetical protein G01um101433_161 [Parcubacteria group bacterium Gr01-1014_33]